MIASSCILIFDQGSGAQRPCIAPQGLKARINIHNAVSSWSLVVAAQDVDQGIATLCVLNSTFNVNINTACQGQWTGAMNMHDTSVWMLDSQDLNLRTHSAGILIHADAAAATNQPLRTIVIAQREPQSATSKRAIHSWVARRTAGFHIPAGGFIS